MPDAIDTDSIPVARGESASFRVAYFDASLSGDTGHQANACRNITGELRERGIRVDVFANVGIQKELAGEVAAIPCFQLKPYEQSRAFGRPDFFIQALSFGHDLRAAWQTGHYPLAYFNSVLSPQFAAIGKWLASFSGGAAPHAAIEFGAPSGASTEGWFRHCASEYRSARRYFQALDPGRILLFTFDSAASAEYSELLGLPVATLPPVHKACGTRRRRARAGDGGITLGFLGQQRTEKGFNLLPEIIRGLRQAGCSARILIHDGDPAVRPASEKVRTISDSDPLVKFVQQPANPAMWQGLLDQTDILVLPYEPNRYRASYSAVAVEAVGAGIPMVVPGGTTMESLAIEYQGRATCFDAWTADAVCRAILLAAGSFESLSAEAFAGAGLWESRNGARRFADRLLDFAASSAIPAGLSAACAPPASRLQRGALKAILAARGSAKRIVHSLLGADRHST